MEKDRLNWLLLSQRGTKLVSEPARVHILFTQAYHLPRYLGTYAVCILLTM